MLTLKIREDEYDLEGDKIYLQGVQFDKQEILLLYDKNDVVKITDNTGKIYDELILEDLFDNH